jgi:hypothetical protein
VGSTSGNRLLSGSDIGAIPNVSQSFRCAAKQISCFRLPLTKPAVVVSAAVQRAANASFGTVQAL